MVRLQVPRAPAMGAAHWQVLQLLGAFQRRGAPETNLRWFLVVHPNNADYAHMRILKEIYWVLRARGRHVRAFELYEPILKSIGVDVQLDPFRHWSRVVMDGETMRLIEQVQPETKKVLEISGVAWKDRCKFRSYRSVRFPDYDVCTAPLPESFDLIIAEQVWEHLKWPYRAGRNVHAMLEAEGFFLITTPFLVKLHREPLDCSRWSEDGLRYFLAECGFPEDRITTGSWGNRACLKANFTRWVPYKPSLHSLRNEADFPVAVWALAQKGSASNA